MIHMNTSLVRFGPCVAICAAALGAVPAISRWPRGRADDQDRRHREVRVRPSKEITVEPGTRLRWTNHDETPHTVTSQDGKKVLASPGMDVGDQYEFVFATEGDFAYFCTVHPMMTGVVHVRKSAGKAS